MDRSEDEKPSRRAAVSSLSRREAARREQARRDKEKRPSRREQRERAGRDKRYINLKGGAVGAPFKNQI